VKRIERDEARNFENHSGFNCHMTHRLSLSYHSPFISTNPIFLSLFISISFLTIHHTPFFHSPKPRVLFLGAFEKLRKPIIIFVVSIGLSVRQSVWNISAPTGRIFVKFYICRFFRKSVEKIQVSLKFDKNKGHFT